MLFELNENLFSKHSLLLFVVCRVSQCISNQVADDTACVVEGVVTPVLVKSKGGSLVRSTGLVILEGWEVSLCLQHSC